VVVGRLTVLLEGCNSCNVGQKEELWSVGPLARNMSNSCRSGCVLRHAGAIFTVPDVVSMRML
jgi:hypothetical protein